MLDRKQSRERLKVAFWFLCAAFEFYNFFQKINKPVFTFLFMLKKKSGQFFLIAAVVIIVVIVSVVTISNYTTKKQTTKLYDLGKELGIESQNVIDYGTYNSQSPDQIKTLMQTFIQNYHDYEEQDKNIYFVFGNNQNIYTIAYQDVSPGEVACVSLNPICCNAGQSCVNGVCQNGNGNCNKNQILCGSNCCDKEEPAVISTENARPGGYAIKERNAVLVKPLSLVQEVKQQLHRFLIQIMQL